MHRILFLLLIATFGIQVSSYAQKTAIMIVRHAEKEASSGEKDPDLSRVGKERAEHLAILLKKVKIDAIFCTKYKRSLQTAKPLAQQNKLNIITYDPADYAELKERILKDYKGKKVVVIAHANTIKPMYEYFGGKIPFLEPLAEDDYDFLFVVLLKNNGNVKSGIRRYGNVHHSTKLDEIQENKLQTQWKRIYERNTNE